ncbi:MAG: aminotransferase class I/II-fold pyridoxal phosphate-dependent enzyme [Elusimicrobiota bacterium]
MPVAAQDIRLRRHLFYETSHSPSLVDIVGYREAGRITDFCYIANPYYPTPAMLRDLKNRLPLLIKSYPSSQPGLSQSHLAQVLHVDPAHLVIGNGASELIAFIEETMVENIGIPVPTFSEYLEKLRDARAARLYPLPADKDYQLDLDAYRQWIRRNDLSRPGDQPRQPHGPVPPAGGHAALPEGKPRPGPGDRGRVVH